MGHCESQFVIQIKMAPFVIFEGISEETGQATSPASKVRLMEKKGLSVEGDSVNGISIGARFTPS